MKRQQAASDSQPLHLRNITRVVEGSSSRIREPIPEGRYSLQKLVLTLSDGWLPFFECHKCGWFESCIFPQRHPANPRRAKDIQCGIAVVVLTNCLRAWWPKLIKFDNDAIQHFIDALFHLIQFVLDSHIGIGTLVSDWDPDWWGPDMALRLTASPLHLREDLDGLARFLKEVPFNFSQSQIVFVEGEAEEAFLKVFRDNRQLSKTGIEVLGGKGNATPERLPVQLLHRQGYRILVQLDRDRSRRRSYRELEKRVRAFGGCVFIFEKDFESAFPAPILAKALETINLSVDVNWLEQRLTDPRAGSIVSALRQKYDCNISKIDLAVNLAQVVEENWADMVAQWPSNEIVRWLLLLRTGHESLREQDNQSAETNVKPSAVKAVNT